MHRYPPRVPRDFGSEEHHVEWWKLLAPLGLIAVSIAILVSY